MVYKRTHIHIHLVDLSPSLNTQLSITQLYSIVQYSKSKLSLKENDTVIRVPRIVEPAGTAREGRTIPIDIRRHPVTVLVHEGTCTKTHPSHHNQIF